MEPKFEKLSAGRKKLLKVLAFFLTILVSLWIVNYAYSETLDAWIAKQTSHKDVATWMDKNWTYDYGRLNFVATMNKSGKIQRAYSPEETFKEKKGICYDAVAFKMYTINKIEPSCKADVVFLDSGPGTITHFVCGFYINGKLYVMDYGIPFGRAQRGMWGPFENLDEYVTNVYLVKSHKSLVKFHFGWPNPSYKPGE